MYRGPSTKRRPVDALSLPRALNCLLRPESVTSSTPIKNSYASSAPRIILRFLCFRFLLFRTSLQHCVNINSNFSFSLLDYHTRFTSEQAFIVIVTRLHWVREVSFFPVELREKNNARDFSFVLSWQSWCSSLAIFMTVDHRVYIYPCEYSITGGQRDSLTPCMKTFRYWILSIYPRSRNRRTTHTGTLFLA